MQQHPDQNDILPDAGMEYHAWYAATKLVADQLGSIDDLPAELRNTVANLYYDYACIKLSLPAPLTDRVPFVFAAVETLPQLIAELRNVAARGDKHGYNIATVLALALFKYQIPEAERKSYVRLKLEMLFRSPPNREIKGLYFATHFPRGYRLPF